jgi:hypothetical protein
MTSNFYMGIKVCKSRQGMKTGHPEIRQKNAIFFSNFTTNFGGR